MEKKEGRSLKAKDRGVYHHKCAPFSMLATMPDRHYLPLLIRESVISSSSKTSFLKVAFCLFFRLSFNLLFSLINFSTIL